MKHPPGQHFPDTRDSLVEALASAEEHARARALELVGRAYRWPVVALLERRWTLAREDAEDLAHEFFAAAFEKNWLPRYDAERGKFRTFLRSCVMSFASTHFEHATRLKRGGVATHEPLTDEVPNANESELDAVFEREWMRSVLQLSLDSFRAEAVASGKQDALKVFEEYDVAGIEARTPVTYAELALAMHLPVTQITNHLAWARRRFREHVLRTLRALTGSDAEYRAEARTLLGVDVS